MAELRTLQRFHDDVLRVFKGVCILMGKEAVRQMNNATGKREEDWVAPSKGLLADMRFLASLREYDKENIAARTIEKLQPIITHENCTVAHLRGINGVAANLCAWVLAMDKFYNVNLVVIPKKASLKVAEAEYAELSEALNIKKENLRLV